MSKRTQNPILPVRCLAWFSFSFGAGCLFSALLTGIPGLVTAGLCLLAAPVFLRLVHSWRIRPVLICIGFALGLLWTNGYNTRMESRIYTPVSLESDFTATVLSQPDQLTSQSRVKIRVDGYCNAYLYYSDDIQLTIGDTISFQGSVSTASVSNQAKGICLYLSGKSLTVTGHSSSPLLWPARFSALMQDIIRSLYADDVMALFFALLTGDKSELSTSVTTSLSRSGLSHIVAVSGMHISCLSGLLFILLKNRRSRLLSIPFLMFFALMVGSVSAYRALFMSVLLLLAPVFHRESDPITSLGCAMLVILLQNPICVQSVSFQLSFSAMVGLTLLAPMLFSLVLQWVRTIKGLSKVGKRLILLLAQAVIICLSATLFTTPLIVWYFNQLSLISLFANLLVTWMLSLLLILGLLSVLAGMLWLPAGQLLAFPATVLANYLLGLVSFLGGLSFASIQLNTPYLVAWGVFAVVMLILLVLMVRDRRLPTIPLCAIVLTLCLSLLLNRLTVDRNALTVQVLDVGQGQSILMISGGYAAAVDCGGNSYDSAGDILADQLQGLGINRLTVMVFTHMDSDHINGIEELFARIQIDRVVLPDAASTEESDWYPILTELCQQQGTQLTFLSSTMTLTFGQVTATIYPPVDSNADNNSCLASLWQTTQFSMLITGDLDSTGEHLLLAHQSLPDIDLLIVGHHGSKYSSSDRLLTAVTPETAIISVGDNYYGHPASDTLDRLSSYSITTFRTDQNGTITISVKE